MSFPAPDLANNWQFIEIWILDPTENYKIVFACSSYEEAKLWLLEDEYERVEGRVLAEQVA
ncbi:hypothetical protein PN497_20410 [Sphaerospermopsis kisseleviana CS-549]|uniref:Uncharacterized protein n=1 Tax=Sphaerospermopsis kisseleviana CS-549 TaxID=3021783 RepID=A0ABT4ZXF0_9CYAN|nr:hypothetical protein [Sphaerospermopsis kisseleviana]MDB9443694.1 hypothetical protein [Sphaerospermopsis kisseleviana CS-549]BAZ83339.1 hypothetical protein NIES73_46260 [Sphaerospermopsis kisseleviana NIES-73]